MQAAAIGTIGTLAGRGTLASSLATLAATIPDAGGASRIQRLSNGWEYLQGSLGGPWEVWRSEEVAVFVPVAMPHCFNAYDGCDPDVPYYRGNGWYRTHVQTANPYQKGRTLLHFEGAGQTAKVYVGEHLAGEHRGGYDEFVVDITELAEAADESALAAKNAAAAAAPAKSGKGKKAAAKTKGLPIAVLCDNSRDLDRIPSDLSDFSLYGGLYRHVNLVYVPEISLERVHVRSSLASATSAARVSVLGTLYFPAPESAAASVRYAVEVTDASGAVVHRSSGTTRPWTGPKEIASFTLEKPKLWSPSQPHLYRCKVSLSGADGGSGGEYAVQENFGIKHTEMVLHGPFKLNGERLLLRGTHRHEDHAGYAAAMPDDLIEQEMTLIKDVGANFIRLAHYQQSRRVLEMCDRLGILVWEEVPWCRGGVGDEAFKTMARDKLRNMIDQHFNHASVLFWGLGNEDDWPTEYPEVNEEKIRSFMQELNELAHSLDSSRYTSFRRCDFARDIPDAYSPSIWAGWYRGTYPEYQAALKAERDRVNHLIHMEWGADSHAGRNSENPDRVLAEIATGHGTDERGMDYLSTGGSARVSRDGDWSETYACNLFDWHLKTQETLPWFMGSAQWIFKDFTTPLRMENPVPRVNQKGMIARDMTKKEGYYVFQSYWAEKPMARIYGHNWPVRWGAANEQKMVKVYSNCETAEMFLNGKSLGTRTRDSQNYPAAGLRWIAPFDEGKNTLRVVARKGAATVEDEIEFLYQTEKWGSPAEMRLTEKARSTVNGQRMVTVEAKLYDAKGVLCLDAKNRVRFSMAGPGTLIDNQGTSNGSRLVEMCNGRSEITLIAGDGRCTVAVATERIPTAFYLVS